jgi:hypothetical protein
MRARGRIRLLPAHLVCAPLAAQASFLAGESLDKAADILAIVVLFVVPLAGIGLFWMVHVLPEKIAEKRHHPPQTAIKTLCVLRLADLYQVPVAALEHAFAGDQGTEPFIIPVRCRTHQQG